MKFLRFVIEAVGFIGLCGVGLIVMVGGLIASPYFLWCWWREESAGRKSIPRYMRRGGFWDHP